jgi:hypothetical protein
MTKQPESSLSYRIMNELRARGIFCFKVHGGPTMMNGLPDVFACVPVQALWRCGSHRAHTDDVPSHHGLLVGFETKMIGNSPSPIQRRRHDQIRESSGLVCVVHSVEEALAFVAWVQAGQPPAEDPRR